MKKSAAVISLFLLAGAARGLEAQSAGTSVVCHTVSQWLPSPVRMIRAEYNDKVAPSVDGLKLTSFQGSGPVPLSAPGRLTASELKGASLRLVYEDDKGASFTLQVSGEKGTISLPSMGILDEPVSCQWSRDERGL